MAILPRAPALAEPCTIAAVREEGLRGIPPGMLLAIAFAESSREGRPQANAVRVGGRSHYPETPEEALRLARQPDGKLEKSANVGCMQLQIASHGAAFDPPERILDPAQNVRHAAQLLVRASGRQRNWARAIVSHRGGGRAGQRDYLCRVWNYLRFLSGASASLIDARQCGQMPRPAIDLNVARLAHELRMRLPDDPPAPKSRPR